VHMSKDVHQGSALQLVPPAQGAEWLVLQTLCLPDPGFGVEEALFLRRNDQVQLSGAGGLDFAPGGAVEFGTCFNLFNLETWSARCKLAGLWLHLSGTGRFSLCLTRVTGGILLGPQEPLIESILHLGEVELTEAGRALDLSGDMPDDVSLDTGASNGGGMFLLSLTAQGPARLQAGAFVTTRPPVQSADPFKLAIVITTFRREAAVTQTADRILAFFDQQSPLGNPGVQVGRAAQLFVVDNGQSLTLAPHPKLTLIPNRNLGGAGGFARGLRAAEDGGFSHCLFMDDDASVQMEALIRTSAFLRLARSPKAALAGAMISETRPWEMWENGAVFHRFCHPLCHGTDLCHRESVLRMELAANRPKPKGFYGGWWFFAFPIAQVSYHPFPFFVRGDDISFSLANRFETATLNGVTSWQEAFAAKESPQTLYLDMRNHLHHHLAQPDLEIGVKATLGIALRFIMRSLARMHYDSAEAQLLAWEDVMQGPDHFTENADLAARRGVVAGLMRLEKWAPSVEPAPALAQPLPLWRTYLMKFTLNGHLLPFFAYFGRKTQISILDRGPIWPVWGAAELQVIDAGAQRSYTVYHDKQRFLLLTLRVGRLTLRWFRRYPGLVRAYRNSYGQIATRAFWQAQFASGPAPIAAVVATAANPEEQPH
jgi:galactofuranosylgalactofuranosylrhamnosyl-N-acetylglucosaminyl-diphospho-decaprenol beta-1,5/1,6-galactofuranosyltransferase